MPLLSVENLRTFFHTRDGVVRAVDGVSFSIEPGETLGIVGESGSGKSVTCYSLMGLVPIPPGRIEGGRATLGDFDLLHASRAARRRVYGNRMSMIFQDPMTALNPYMKIGKQVMEPLLVHGICDRAEARRRALEALRATAIRDAERMMQSYPHELSGGMRQRVMIAMALVTEPELLIADEPTTALDVSVQAQILRQLKELQRQRTEAGARAMAILFITHDLGVVAGICNRIAVMYAGIQVESGTVDDIFYRSGHPYTRALLRAIPGRVAEGEDLCAIPGHPPDLSRVWIGCPFAPRCEFADERCRTTEARLESIGPGHATACLRARGGEI